MRQKDLAVSPVWFDEEQHTYTLDGVQLSGVTSIIGKYICPDKYSNVPTATLEAARKRGTAIHKEIQMAINKATPPEPSEEYKAFRDWMRKSRVQFIASEYLVSDEVNVASSIDLVDKWGNLYDIKTTAELDIEYLRWQLSIYHYLFAKQNNRNMDAEQRLYAIHLRGSECKVVEIEPLPNDYVLGLIGAYALDLEPDEYTNPLHDIPEEERLNKEYKKLSDDIETMSKELSLLEEKRDEIKSALVAYMDNVGITKHESKFWKVTRTPDAVRQKFNEKQFAADHATQYKKYLTDQTVKGRLTITLK